MESDIYRENLRSVSSADTEMPSTEIGPEGWYSFVTFDCNELPYSG